MGLSFMAMPQIATLNQIYLIQKSALLSIRPSHFSNLQIMPKDLIFK